MTLMRSFWIGWAIAGLLAAGSSADEVVRLPDDPDLSADGKRLVFSWRGDIWTASSAGGVIRPLTSSPASDSQPKFSPDGKTVAFISNRTGSNQLHLVPTSGGSVEQLTFHSEGCSLQQWSADGESLLINASRDHYWRHAERFFEVARQPRSLERLLFDDYGQDGRLSADGQRLLFTREGTKWWRKGYHGSQASQVWLFHRPSGKFEQLLAPERGARTPLWHPQQPNVIFYVGGQTGSFNLWRRDIKTGDEEQLTQFPDDSVLMPCISGDGRLIVFRHAFDLFSLRPGQPRPPKRIKLIYRGDSPLESIERLKRDKATDVAFSDDGLEMALIVGGDVWVMDTVLREPRQVTNTPEEERDPVFSPDGTQLLFASDAGGQSDIWRAVRGDEGKYWWRNDRFELNKLTDDPEFESRLQFSPDGTQVAFLKQRGDLWVMKPDGQDARKVVASWNPPDYDWSPDGQWLTYALGDNDFNHDVFVAPLDGSRPPFNVSQHPDNDSGPVWSPDGKVLAFVGRRLGTETDIYFVYLRKAEDQEGTRDRKFKAAMEKIGKLRKPAPQPASKTTTDPANPVKQEEAGGGSKSEKPEVPSSSQQPAADEKQSPPEKTGPKLPKVSIDFDQIDERIRRVSIEGVEESGLFWSPDSKRLAFTATIGGKRGTYTIAPPDDLTPKLLSSTTGNATRWISQGNQIVWLVSGVPGSLNTQGQAASYSFSARQQVDRAAHYQAAFDMCWREMRDHYYDELLNHRNWDAIRRKYQPLARDAVDAPSLATVVNLMLGELNGSHLGFYSRNPSTPSPKTPAGPTSDWQESTAHLGTRFDFSFPGPGLRIKDVIPGSPADQQRGKLQAGEIILRINGTQVDRDLELTSILNGPLDRDMQLDVSRPDGKTRQVTLRPISFAAARGLLYEKWIRDCQATVEELSEGKFGYVHIQGMNMTSFYRFERELYSVAAGKQGLVIDVRENGGGFTTDHLLTVLTQPVHAVTVPRGGGPGYPHDRQVYATWRQPVVVLCNQNSFSNAEIFSHAIKSLQRGQLVGVPTAGGVISTGGTNILDVGFLRKPFRGWFVAKSGQDMELNGAVPDHIVWPHPGDMPQGRDLQLNKAVEVLKADVEDWQKRPQPALIKASQRKAS